MKFRSTKKIGPEINPGPIGWVKSIVGYPV
jgi:hypothetical protein